jgi:glycosyltransferase involved in cell wall biosynthesis
MRDVSVILATMNRPADVRSVLGSLLTQTLAPVEILLIDQSRDNLTQILTADFKKAFADKGIRLEYLRQEEKSLVKARNLGIDTAAGDLISFVDDDAVLYSDYYEKIDLFLEQHPDIGALSGSQILPSRPSGLKWTVRKAIMRLFMISNCDGLMTPSGFGYPISYEKEVDRVLYVEMLPGCNMNFTKEAVGSDRFDEWFSGYGFREDADFSYRISKKTRVAMIPDAKLRHQYSAGNRLDISALKKMEMRNYRHVFNKHRKGSLFSVLFFFYSLAGLVLIDLMQFLSRLNMTEFKKFRATVYACIDWV